MRGVLGKKQVQAYGQSRQPVRRVTGRSKCPNAFMMAKGNPCGFKSSFRHHINNERDFGFPPESLFSFFRPVGPIWVPKDFFGGIRGVIREEKASETPAIRQLNEEGFPQHAEVSIVN